MKYLDHLSITSALKWMTAVEQLLGVTEDGRVRWVRIDPMAAEGIEIRLFDEPLACDRAEVVDEDTPRITGGPLPPPVTIRSATDAPRGIGAADLEHAAVLWAQFELGADPNRWVHTAHDGWRYLCLLRGHG